MSNWVDDDLPLQGYLFSYVLGSDDAASDANALPSASEAARRERGRQFEVYEVRSLARKRASGSASTNVTAVGYVLDRYAARARATARFNARRRVPHGGDFSKS